ncbi:MAG: ATP-binding cassette domain-containing protein [Eubacteriales bacterium]|nr:ATP-binding cassette domain-containing protein [Eubacteriales bacterium]
MDKVVLDIQKLTLGYDDSKPPIVSNLYFQILKGETLCLHGSSGCGKSTVIWAIMGKLSRIGGFSEGKILYEGKDILNDMAAMEAARWEKIALVPQSSMSAFNPVYKMKKTYMELLNLKRKNLTGKEKENLIREKLEIVQLKENVLEQYPHELSGGMRQRAAIALALILDPELLILDEATTGLDVLVEADILWTLKKIRREKKMSMLVVSHDTRIANAFCDRRIHL